MSVLLWGHAFTFDRGSDTLLLTHTDPILSGGTYLPPLTRVLAVSSVVTCQPMKMCPFSERTRCSALIVSMVRPSRSRTAARFSLPPPGGCNNVKSNMIQQLLIQDFPEGAPTTKVGVLTYYFVNILDEKLHEKWKNFDCVWNVHNRESSDPLSSHLFS